jgi:hypothetical protein
MPSIDDVVEARIIRIPTALADHGGAAIAAALDPHAVHNHDLDLTAAIVDGAGTRVQATSPGGPMGYPGGGVTIPGGAGGVLDNAAVQAHTFAGGAPVVHAGANPVLLPTCAKIVADPTERTFSISITTLVGDLVTLVYMERGARLRPA